MLAGLFRRIFDRLAGRSRDESAAPPAVPEPPVSPSSGIWPQPSGRSFSSMSPGELLALENENVSNIGRRTDLAEAVADERQDPSTSLNFPLHWTTAADSWNYLFDFAIACDLLAPRPDDLVLDFAAGTSWASECLLRLGVRPVAVDLSVEMMRRGRQRLGADARLVFRDQAKFVAARGQSLPFLSATFDGVVCMNALHHLPSYADAFSEIQRVLKPGGRAVFSEPGAGHALHPRSRYRMREEDVIEKNVPLALIRHLAQKAGFTRMRVVPLRAASTYAFDYDASVDAGQALDEMWSATLRLAPGEHARFVLFKGDAPPADTLLPPQLLAGRLRAEIAPPEDATVRTQARIVHRLRIRNSGSVTWKAHGRRFGGQVTCGLKILTEEGVCLREDLGRTPLLRDVGPGEEIEADMVIEAALAPGKYCLHYDMVVEGVIWFEHLGSPTPRRRLTITP